jgi:hypothetical protein
MVLLLVPFISLDLFSQCTVPLRHGDSDVQYKNDGRIISVNNNLCKTNPPPNIYNCEDYIEPGIPYVLTAGTCSWLVNGTDTILCEDAGNLCNILLPVTWLSFSGKQVGYNIKLEWVTVTEYNNSHFIIERSVNGETWLRAGKVEGSFNSSVERKYTFREEIIPFPWIYYRIMQVDYDNEYSYSPIISIPTSFIDEEYKVYDLSGKRVRNMEKGKTYVLYYKSGYVKIILTH